MVTFAKRAKGHPYTHRVIEDRAAQMFKTLVFSLSSLAQRGYISEQFGIAPKMLCESMREAFGGRKRAMRESTAVFRVLVKTL